MIFKISKLCARYYSTRALTNPILRIPANIRSQHSSPKDPEHDSELSEAEMELCDLIGNREIVGYGINGQPSYIDNLGFPFPAIRWKECTQELMALKEKEKGDWKALSEVDKKALYRASFRQTFAEMKAPTGQWKSIVGYSLFYASLGIWMWIFICIFIHNPIPHTFKPDNQRAQLKRILDLQVDPITGITAKWDKEKGEWK